MTTQSPWISVKDRLPEPDVLVLVSHLMEDFSRPATSYYSCRELCYWRRKEWRTKEDICVPSVTHWMHIPDAPQPEDPFDVWWDREGKWIEIDHARVRLFANHVWNAALASQKTSE